MSNEIKNFSLSIGIRGKVLGYDAIASYSRQRGQNCIQGKVTIEHENAVELVNLVSKELADALAPVIPDNLKDISAEMSFGNSYDHQFLKISTAAVKLSLIKMTGSGAAVLIEITDGRSSGGLTYYIQKAKELFGLDKLYFYASSSAALDIGRLLSDNTEYVIVPPDDLYSEGGFCLYADYDFSKYKSFINDFMYQLLGIDRLAFFAGKNDNGVYFALSAPKIQNNVLTVEKLYFQAQAGNSSSLKAYGNIRFSAVPELSFGISCQISPESVMLSAAAVADNPVELFSDFYLGSASLTIGYSAGGLIFGLSGEMYLRQLYLYGAVQLAIYGEVVKPQLLSFSTGTLSFKTLYESITGTTFSGIELLNVIGIDNFDFNFGDRFSADILKNRDIPAIVEHFNRNVADKSFTLSANSVALGQAGSDDGYSLVDKSRMRHYYIDKDGKLSLRPQFYYSDVSENFMLADGSMVSAGIFFCAKIWVFNVDIKALFSFRKNEGVIAFAMLSDIDLGFVKITGLDKSKKDPIPLPENSLLYEFIDKRSNGVVFYLQASKKDASFYFEGKISILNGLFSEQAQLYYKQDTIIANLESSLLGMTTKVSLSANFSKTFDPQYTGAGVSVFISFDTSGLEAKLKGFSDKLMYAVDKCREKVNSAKQSLENAKSKVNKLYDEVNSLKRKVDSLRNELSRMGFWKRLVYAIPYGAEISGLEIAIGALYASVGIAEAALTVAEAAVEFAGRLSEGVLKAINSVITSITSIFFIRKLTAYAEAGTSKTALEFTAEFVVLGKDYTCSWSMEHNIAGDIERGIGNISDRFSDKTARDMKDLENGELSSVPYRKPLLLNADDTPVLVLEDALDTLSRNGKIMAAAHDQYYELFGESAQEFDAAELEYLETISAISVNADIANRAAQLDDLKDTVDELRVITSENAHSLIAMKAADAVERYDDAVKRSEELKILVESLSNHKYEMRSARLSRRAEINRVMGYRGTYKEFYDGDLYKYISELRKKAEEVYEGAPSTYTNPVNDSQISEMLKQLEEHYRYQ